jgi:hypothetical protein
LPGNISKRKRKKTQCANGVPNGIGGVVIFLKRWLSSDVAM